MRRLLRGHPSRLARTIHPGGHTKCMWAFAVPLIIVTAEKLKEQVRHYITNLCKNFQIYYLFSIRTFILSSSGGCVENKLPNFLPKLLPSPKGFEMYKCAIAVDCFCIGTL